jgi:hypothetical protein
MGNPQNLSRRALGRKTREGDEAFITETQRSTEGHGERQQLGVTTARHAEAGVALAVP